MDSKESRPVKGEAGGVVLTKPTPSRPTLALPSRFPADALIRTSDASPSPMTLMSSLLAEQEPDTDCKSYSQLVSAAMVSPTPKSSEPSNNIGVSTEVSQCNSASGTLGKDAGKQGPAGNGDPVVARSSIARFKTMTPSRLPIPRSPYLTIPPGLSPTTLLDSPVLLSTSQAEPSPTTGSFPLPPFIHGSGSTSASASDILKEKTSEQDHSPSFVFKPFPKLGRNPLSTLVNMGPFGFSHQQVLAEVQAQAHAQIPSSLPPSTGPTSIVAPVSAGSLVTSVSVAKFVPPLQCKGPMELTSQPLSEKLEKVHLPELPAAPFMVERPSEDGYNWRKYGQKQVKGSEYPRSYYKCTYPNCPVKKKVERSHDGQVTEIVYKGEHNHPKPQATRRMSMNTAHLSDSMASRKIDALNTIVKADGSSQVHPSDLKSERMSSVSDLTSSSKGPFNGEVSGTTEPSSGSTSDDEGEDGSKVEDGDDDGPDSKRRKKEAAKEAVTIVPLRTIREPRVVVQTTSDVDILDDGYRWRKYGQKVVKGNPHPRSYYKCTNLGCSVRKHVERSSTDPKAVITTYEGKHNHDVPAARSNSSHDITGSAVSTVPLPAPAHTSFGGNAVAKPSASLQDQFYLGKLLEDRLKASDRNGNGSIASGVLASDQKNRDQGRLEISSQASIGLMSSVITSSKPLESSESFGQSLVLRPKEEQGDIHSLGNSIQLAFSSGSPSLCQGMPERLVLGP